MFSRESTCTSAVLAIILLFSLLNNHVIGKPLMLDFLEEEWPDFQPTYRDGTQLMEEKLIKRDPSVQNHLSDSVKPLVRLLRLQKLDNTTADYGSKTVRPRVRFGKRLAT